MDCNNSLWDIFLSNQGKTCHKVFHYFPIYERHFRHFVNRPIVFWEIGVSKGGSLQMWKKYFGPFAVIIGIDINGECKEHEKPQLDIHVRIGSQSDERFLLSVLREFGRPDIVLDDGSHKMKDVNATFEFLYYRMNKNGVYFVEDLCTAYWNEYGGSLCGKDTFIEKCKGFLDSLNGFNIRNGDGGMPDKFTEQTFSMCAYDSIVVFEKMEGRKKLATFSTPDDM